MSPARWRRKASSARPSCTTRPAKGITIRSARSSRVCAARTRTPPCTGWRRCCTRARTSGSSRGGSSFARRRTWAWPIRRRWWSRWRRSRRRSSSGCPRRASRWRRRPFTSPPHPRATARTWPWKRRRRRKCARGSRWRCRCICAARVQGREAARAREVDYQYSHDHEDAYVPQAYLPEGRRYYEPSDRGHEKRIGERLAHWRALFEQSQQGGVRIQRSPRGTHAAAGGSGSARPSRLVRKKNSFLERQQADPQPRICRGSKEPHARPDRHLSQQAEENRCHRRPG